MVTGIIFEQHALRGRMKFMESNGYWLAMAEYADGTHIKKKFPYDEEDNYRREEERKCDLEWWLIEQGYKRKATCVWYSVCFIDE